MDNFVYHGNISSVIVAVRLANQVLSNPVFLNKLRFHPGFDFSSNGRGKVTGEEIYQLLTGNCPIVEVRTYKAWFWSKVVGYTSPADPKTIFLNTRMLGDPEDTAGCCIHEYVHVLDTFSPLQFGHGDNYSSGKSNSAPYYIGYLASMVLEKKI